MTAVQCASLLIHVLCDIDDPSRSDGSKPELHHLRHDMLQHLFFLEKGITPRGNALPRAGSMA